MPCTPRSSTARSSTAALDRASRRVLAWLLMSVSLAGLAACTHEGHYRLHQLHDLMPALKFTLENSATGTPVNARSYAGKVVLLYFGYTHCPDVCPTTLTRLESAVRALRPGDRRQVRILFVTVDPRRDTDAVLRSYAAAFGPELIALRGTKPQIDALTARYRVSYAFGKPDAKGAYAVTHGSAVFIFDRRGRARLLAEPDDGAAAITADLHELIRRS